MTKMSKIQDPKKCKTDGKPSKEDLWNSLRLDVLSKIEEKHSGEQKILENSAEVKEEPMSSDIVEIRERMNKINNAHKETTRTYNSRETTPYEPKEEITRAVKCEINQIAQKVEEIERKKCGNNVEENETYKEAMQLKVERLKRTTYSRKRRQELKEASINDDRAKAKTLNCRYCGKSYSSYVGRLHHERSRHILGKVFACSFCGKTFYSLQQVQTHNMIHTGERPYECKECGKSFTQKATLIQHKRTHTKEKRFKCGECGKAFARRGDLTRHTLTHRRLKPFKCEICDMMFTRKHFMERHVRRKGRTYFP